MRHHSVHITDEALIAAATLSDRYIRDKSLPDKAIDLIDEACSRVKLDIEAPPIEIQNIVRILRNLRAEQISLSVCAMC